MVFTQYYANIQDAIKFTLAKLYVLAHNGDALEDHFSGLRYVPYQNTQLNKNERKIIHRQRN